MILFVLLVEEAYLLMRKRVWELWFLKPFGLREVFEEERKLVFDCGRIAYLACYGDDEVIFGVEVGLVIKKHLLSETFDILFSSDSWSSITIISEIIILPFLHRHSHRIIFIHFQFLDDDSFLSFKFFLGEYRMEHHIREDIDGLMYEFWCAFHVIACVFISSIGIKLSTKFIYRFGYGLGSRVFLSSFEKKMFQEMADTIIFLGFIDTSSSAHDLYRSGICILHRSEDGLDSGDGFDFVFHDR